MLAKDCEDLLRLGISGLEEELTLARKEGESLQGAEADLKATLAQKEFSLLEALASSEARRANEAALRSALQNQEKLLADERVAKDTAERQLVQSATQLAEMQADLAEMQMSRDEQNSLTQTLQSQLRSSEVAFNAKLEETAHSESTLREKLQASGLTAFSNYSDYIHVIYIRIYQCCVVLSFVEVGGANGLWEVAGPSPGTIKPAQFQAQASSRSLECRCRARE